MGTITSNSKSKSKKVSNNPETDDNTPTKVFDFSSGKPLIQVTIPQIITGIIFAFSIGWFIASQWVFDVKSERLKNEILESTGSKIDEKVKALNESINSGVDKGIQNLKLKNSYLK